MHRQHHILTAVLVIGGATAAASTAVAQDYPAKAIRIVTSPAGGGNDFVARLVAQGITGPLGQPVVIDNRPTPVIGETVARTVPDGYTLLVAGSSFMIGHLIQQQSFDPVRDFAPISLAGTAPNVVLVHPSLPVKSVRELITLAKARPGELNYASSGTGSTQYLSAELFKSMAGITVVNVAYGGGGPGLIALISGEVQLIFSPSSTAAPIVKSGKARALAVTSLKPSALAPGLPTVSETGLPGYEVISVDAVWAPAKTPAAIINRLSQEIAKAINRPDIRQRYFDAGVDVVGSTPEALAGTLQSEIAKWGKVIKSTNARPQ